MTSCIICIGGNPCPCQARQEQQRRAGLGPRREQSHQDRLAAALGEPLAADATWIEDAPAETHPGRLRGLWRALRGKAEWRWW